MCVSRKELNSIMEEIQSFKKLKEETEDKIRSLERLVIDFLDENEQECKTVNDKGKESLKFIGNILTATLSEQERETVNKDEVKKILSDEEFQKVSKISKYRVLRIK